MLDIRQGARSTGTGLTPSTGRRTQSERKAASRQAILDAALDAFNQNGYHATTMADIADAAGVSKGLLHYHFQNKETLMLAVEEQISRRIFETITDTASQLQPSLKNAIWALDELWQGVGEASHLVPVVVELAARSLTNADTRERFGAISDMQVQMLVEGIERVLGPLQEQTDIDVNTLADLILVTLGGMAISSVFMPADDDQSGERVDKVFQLFKRMVLQTVLPNETAKEAT